MDLKKAFNIVSEFCLIHIVLLVVLATVNYVGLFDWIHTNVSPLMYVLSGLGALYASVKNNQEEDEQE
jgi:hypothetical protein